MHGQDTRRTSARYYWHSLKEAEGAVPLQWQEEEEFTGPLSKATGHQA